MIYPHGARALNLNAVTLVDSLQSEINGQSKAINQMAYEKFVLMLKHCSSLWEHAVAVGANASKRKIPRKYF